MIKIYMYTNTADNNKKYIGQTKLTLKERAGSNFINYKESWKFYEAIQKFGIASFTTEILFKTTSKEIANEKEKEYISKFHTLDNDYGYNIQPGGSSFIMNNEIRQKIGMQVKSSKKFQKNNFKAHAKPIVAININNKNILHFQSATQASSSLNISRGSISAICRGKGKALSLKGYIFMFEANFIDSKKDEYITKYIQRKSKQYDKNRNEKMRSTLLKKYKEDSSSFNHLRKKVCCIETGEVFNSIEDAAKSKNIAAPSNISLVCKGKRSTAAGLHWKFLSSTTIPDECKGVESKS